MKDEYAKVGVPMLPVVRGEAETRRQIVLYTVLLYAVTQLPFCAAGSARSTCVASLALGGAFIYLAVRLQRRADRRAALRRLPVLAGLPGAAVRVDGPGRPDLVKGAPYGPPTRPQERPLRPPRRRDLLLHVRHDLRRGRRLRLLSP